MSYILTGEVCPDESQGFHTHRASDRCRDHRHLGRDRASEVREHEGEGVSGVDEVGPAEPDHGREAYFADSVKYTANTSCVTAPGTVAFCTTTGVLGPTIAVTADGFTATVSHTTTTKTCAVYVGSTALAPANKEGEPKCA